MDEINVGAATIEKNIVRRFVFGLPILCRKGEDQVF